jgi:hypothetical protein
MAVAFMSRQSCLGEQVATSADYYLNSDEEPHPSENKLASRVARVAEGRRMGARMTLSSGPVQTQRVGGYIVTLSRGVGAQSIFISLGSQYGTEISFFWTRVADGAVLRYIVEANAKALCGEASSRGRPHSSP